MKDNFSMYTYFYLKQTLLGTELLMEWCCNWRKLSFLWRHPYDVAKLSSLKNCKVVIFVFVWLVFYQILANSSKILGSMIFLDLSLGTLKYYLYLMWLIEIEFSEKKHMWILKIWQNWFGSVPTWYMNFSFYFSMKFK